jgi:two-component system, cell cycle sensor histidine kinase and response regulator CckA
MPPTDPANGPHRAAGQVAFPPDRVRSPQADPVPAELLQSQNDVLALVARNAPLHQTLDFLLRSIEAQFPGMLASILLLDEDGVHVRHGAAPSLPEAYVRAVDGESIGPQAGSCGTAAYRGEPVIVEDIATDPLWMDYRELALSHGLRACWSTPIFDGQKRVLGTFALYFRVPMGPTKQHRQVIELTTYTVAIAIAARQERAARELAEAERTRLTEALRQVQKIDSLGRLAGGIAHDFNNLLMVIEGHADLVLQDLPPEDPLRGSVEDIRRAASRATDLTRQLLAFSRGQLLNPRVLDLNASLRDSTRMLRRLLGEHIDLTTSLDDKAGPIKADPGQLDQVIVNLAVNARDAMPQGGRVSITTRNVTIDEIEASGQPTFRSGSYVLLTFSDTGHGISEDILPQIFEPFFTTKGQGKGTGLGLAMVYGILKQSGGWISVSSEVGRGTTFEIYLPRVEAPLSNAVPAPAIEIKRGSETVLVVEDEEPVRRLACHALRTFGYDVLDAANGDEAVLLCEQRRRPIPLLVTDVIMPGMSGPQLVERLSERYPEMRVVYISGYTDVPVLHPPRSGEPAAFLQKPFTAADLRRKVREVLDSA